MLTSGTLKMRAVSTPATTAAKTARTIAVILQPRWAAVSRVPAANVAAARMPRITVITPSPTVPPFPMPEAEMPKGPEAHGRMEPSRMAQMPPYPSSRLPFTSFLPERLRWPRVRHLAQALHAVAVARSGSVPVLMPKPVVTRTSA
jgi:hypothetical protein